MTKFKKTLITAGVILATTIVAGCSKSSTGRNQIMLFSETELNKMGSQSFEELKSKEKISQNTQLNNYVQCVAKSVTKHVDKSVHDGNWEVVVFESDQVNAFALPGGKIGVYRGILNVATDADQLAAIIGHEIGHVIEHHSNERLSSGQIAQAGLTAASVFLETQNIENKNLWMAGLGLGVQYGVIMPYGRSHESEADIVGQDLMARAGFQPKAAISLWVNMGKLSKGAPPEFMSTHPSNKTRIDQLSAHLPIAMKKLDSSARANCKRP